MKTIKTAFILCVSMLFCVSSYGKTTAISCFNKKDPWKSLMSVMYAHGKDTTGLNVLSVFSLKDIKEITPDLAKAYRVSEPIQYDEAQNLGTVITDYMKAKYGDRTGEKYYYYKNRFNPDYSEADYKAFVLIYPRSRYADELKSKALCLDQCGRWFSNTTNEESYETYREYGVSHCPYPGFVSIADNNNSYRKTLEDWDQLQKELASTGWSDCEAYYTFWDSHYASLSSFYWAIPDSISQCEQRQQQKAWREACRMHTVEGYQNYLQHYPDAQETKEVERRIEDITAWQRAVAENTHESYSRYYNEFLDGDSVNVAGERLRIMEEAAWQKAQKKNSIASYEGFVKQYPDGYYSNLALNRQLELEIKKFNPKKGGAITKMELMGVSSQPSYSLLCFGNVGKNYDITVSLLGSTPVKVVLKPGQSHWARVKNGQYKIYVTSSNGSEWNESGHGCITVEDGLYAMSWYSFTYKTYTYMAVVINDQSFIDKLAEARISREIENRAQLEVDKLMKQDVSMIRKIIRNVARQKLEAENNQKEYEKICRDTEDDENVYLMLKYFLLWLSI